MTPTEATEIIEVLQESLVEIEEVYWDVPADLSLDEPTKAYLRSVLRAAIAEAVAEAEQKILLVVLRLRDGAERPKDQAD